MESLLSNMKPLDNIELLSEMALFSFLNEGDAGKEGLMFLSGAKVVHELYRRYTQTDTIIEALRADAIRKISAYVEKNPRASTDDQAREIKKQIDDFAVKVAVVSA